LKEENRKYLLGYGGIFIGIPIWIFLSGQMGLSNNKVLGFIGLLMLGIPIAYLFAFIFHILIMIQLSINKKSDNRFSGFTAFLIAYIPLVVLLMLLFLFEPAFRDLISF